MRLGHLNGLRLLRRREETVHDRIWHGLETTGLMIFVHDEGLVLPDITERRDKGDVTARALQVVSDIVHLFQEQLAGLEREAFGGLVRVVEIILRVRKDSDGEFGIDGRHPGFHSGCRGFTCRCRTGADQRCSHQNGRRCRVSRTEREWNHGAASSLLPDRR